MLLLVLYTFANLKMFRIYFSKQQCYDEFYIKDVCFRPTPLILDEQGRTIDAKTGQAIQLALHTPTLKVRHRRSFYSSTREVQVRSID